MRGPRPSSPGARAGVVLVAAVFLAEVSGCARQPERQWYKIGQPYSMAEFQRDRAECTRGRQLDFACMRARGWVDVSPDRPPPAPEPERPPRRY